MFAFCSIDLAPQSETEEEGEGERCHNRRWSDTDIQACCV